MSKSEIDAWIESRPACVQEAFKKCPPTTCYRLKGRKGHYALYSYDEEKDGTVTVKVDHLDDSWGYGLRVFGIALDDLERCGCRVQ